MHALAEMMIQSCGEDPLGSAASTRKPAVSVSDAMVQGGFVTKSATNVVDLVGTNILLGIDKCKYW